MVDWFETLAARTELSADAASELHHRGFIVMPGRCHPSISAWHGHTANTTDAPRRSLQGAFIPRDGQAATDFAARMQPETRARLTALAREVLAA
jgi:predicted nucleotide-binding protein (sugar kinase/HSP70/actin superfamily)